MMLPPLAWDPHAAEFIFIVGFLAMWRYGWGFLNWCRFHIYTKLVFPKWRKAADALDDEHLPPHVYLLVTSFRIGAETTRRVYDSVFAEAINYGRPVTIIASVVERGDQHFIKTMFESFSPPEHVKLTFVRIAGTGKRDALACGFRSISKMQMNASDVAAVVDGDSMLELGALRKTVGIFALMPDLGAITTDESCEVDGKWIFGEWYSMRFAQRHMYMSSVSLSRRVLTLTGRMSMFRAEILTRPDFIERVELDWIDHWRLGRFKFLTGDDKSSWFYMAKQGIPMLYIPDVNVVTIETPPHDSFIKSSLVLMRRWFGNMLRTNGRAIGLGPKPLNFFPWYTIVDQRISMWTSLIGFAVAIMASFALTPYAIFYYMWWMLFTRYVITLSLLAPRPEGVSAFWPFLLYYNQIVGSLMKVFVLFRLDKQRWTRQDTKLELGRSSFEARLINYSSVYMHAFAVAIFLGALALSLIHI